MSKRIITKDPDLLSQAVQRPYSSPHFITKGVDADWSIPVDTLRIAHDWYLEKYEIIGSAPPASVIIDAGCKSGDWISHINHLLPKSVKRVAIDPIDYNSMQWHSDYYYKCALDNVDCETTMTFNLFDEPGCNSLLPRSDHLHMRNVVDTITVPVRTLESILIEKFPLSTIVHYMKCDCQGKDVAAVESLREFLKNTRYVQVECSFSHEQPFYVEQPSYEDDIIAMDKIGFEPIFWIEYPESPLPEGEILFKNKNYKG